MFIIPNKTHEQFCEDIFNLVGDEFTIIDTYVRAKLPIRIRHNICGCEFERRANNFLNRPTCGKCSRKKQPDLRSTRLFEKANILAKQYNGLYLDTRDHMSTRQLLWKCDNGHQFYLRIYSVERGKWCPICIQNKKDKIYKAKLDVKMSKPIYSFTQEVLDLVGEEYTVLIDSHFKTFKSTVRHNVCGNQYEIIPDRFIRGSRCSKCKGLKKKTTEEFSIQVQSQVNQEYTVIGTYINARTKITMKHNICGHIYDVNPNAFLHGARCPECIDYSRSTTSYGEEKIENWLLDNHVEFKKEWTFKDCVGKKNKLPFDFAVLKDNNLICLVEYDGEQHFNIIPKFGEEKLKDTQRTDDIKNRYCQTYGIELIRIPYWEFKNIEAILKRELHIT